MASVKVRLRLEQHAFTGPGGDLVAVMWRLVGPRAVGPWRLITVDSLDREA